MLVELADDETAPGMADTAWEQVPTRRFDSSSAGGGKEYGKMNIPTRESLLSRIKDVSRDDSWKEFFDTYWRLIYGSARKSGLSDAEAQDVVQETMLTLAKQITKFDHRNRKGSFKGWLMQL